MKRDQTVLEAIRWSGDSPACEVAPMSDGLISAGIGAGVVAVSAVGALIAASVPHLPADVGFMVVLATIGSACAGLWWVSR